jgi:hypothetical protein
MKPTPKASCCVAYICRLFIENSILVFTVHVWPCQRNNLTVRRPGLLLLAVKRHYMLQGTRLLILAPTITRHVLEEKYEIVELSSLLVLLLSKYSIKDAGK